MAAAQTGLHAQLFGDAECAELFSGAAEIAAMLRVEAALAKAQGACGVIPADAAAALSQALPAMLIPPQELAEETGRNGVPVPALITAIRKRLDDKGAGQWLHWGATSQDIVDTALGLRLREVELILLQRLDGVCGALAELAQKYAETPIVGRTYGQAAAPTTFGALVASWGSPLLRYRARLTAMSPDLLKVQLAGAVGNLSALGEKGHEVRAALASELGLADPGASWHSERDSLAVFSSWLAGVSGSLGKFAEDVIALSQTGIDEIRLRDAGGSSTMPQKQNPVQACAIAALARRAIGLSAIMQGTVLHRQNRDGSTWFTEWLTLPDLCVAACAALRLSEALVRSLMPDAANMQRNLAAQGGVIYAEALSFALSKIMPRAEAQEHVKRLCREVAAKEVDLFELTAREFPGTDWRAAAQVGATGDAAEAARRFAAAARVGGNSRQESQR